MTAAPEGGEWSAACPGRTLPRERRGTHCIGGPKYVEFIEITNKLLLLYLLGCFILLLNYYFISLNKANKVYINGQLIVLFIIFFNISHIVIHI